MKEDKNIIGTRENRHNYFRDTRPFRNEQIKCLHVHKRTYTAEEITYYECLDCGVILWRGEK